MLLDYYDYVGECIDNIHNENLKEEAALTEVGYYLDRNIDEIIASYIMRYGTYTVDNFEEIYAHFENTVITELNK